MKRYDTKKDEYNDEIIKSVFQKICMFMGGIMFMASCMMIALKAISIESINTAGMLYEDFVFLPAAGFFYMLGMVFEIVAVGYWFTAIRRTKNRSVRMDRSVIGMISLVFLIIGFVLLLLLMMGNGLLVNKIVAI